MGAARLAVPAGDAGEAMGDVLDLDVERRGVEQVEPAARQHALPGARRRIQLARVASPEATARTSALSFWARMLTLSPSSPP
jgi:hypothetical protein